jgi:hypothetical protein
MQTRRHLLQNHYLLAIYYILPLPLSSETSLRQVFDYNENITNKTNSVAFTPTERVPRLANSADFCG